jgi:hypothetical protein
MRRRICSRRGHSVIRGFRLNGFDRIAESARAGCASRPPYPAASPIPRTPRRDSAPALADRSGDESRVALRRPRGSAARRSPRSRRSKTGGPGPALRVSRVNVLLGRRSLVRARNGMAALARTPIFPEATPVGALSAQERNRSRGSRGERALGSNEPLEATALSPRGCLLRAGLRFESPQLHHPVWANSGGFRI